MFGLDEIIYHIVTAILAVTMLAVASLLFSEAKPMTGQSRRILRENSWSLALLTLALFMVLLVNISPQPYESAIFLTLIWVSSALVSISTFLLAAPIIRVSLPASRLADRIALAPKALALAAVILPLLQALGALPSKSVLRLDLILLISSLATITVACWIPLVRRLSRREWPDWTEVSYTAAGFIWLTPLASTYLLLNFLELPARAAQTANYVLVSLAAAIVSLATIRRVVEKSVPDLIRSRIIYRLFLINILLIFSVTASTIVLSTSHTIGEIKNLNSRSLGFVTQVMAERIEVQVSRLKDCALGQPSPIGINSDCPPVTLTPVAPAWSEGDDYGFTAEPATTRQPATLLVTVQGTDARSPQPYKTWSTPLRTE